MNSPLISIIVASQSAEGTRKFLNSIVKQSFRNIELIVGYQSDLELFDDDYFPPDVQVRVCRCNRPHGKYDLQLSDNEIYIQSVSMAKGDYVLLTEEIFEYPTDYLENTVLELQRTNADYCVSNYSVHWPDDNLTEYQILNYCSSVLDFFKNCGIKWWVHTVENKIFKKDLIKTILSDLSLFYKKNNSFFYLESLILSSLVISKTSNVCYQTLSYTRLNWKKQDSKIVNLSKYKKSSNLIDETYKAFDYIEDVCSDYISPVLFSSMKNDFISRIVWRFSWKFNDLSEIIKNHLKNYSLSEYSLDKIGSDGIPLDPEAEKSKFEVITDSSDNLKIAIYVSMHKEAYVPNIDYIIPIQVGASISDKRMQSILHDDDYEDNISEKNKMYCEMTAQYLVWKNIKDYDYYGFWHYRRYFSFNPNEVEDEYALIRHKQLNEESLKCSYIDDEHILEACRNFDIILPNEWHIKENGKYITVYEQWCNHFNKDDLDATIKVILQKYPDYSDAVSKVMYSEYAVYCNMFIMKKSYFEEYSKFCFDILSELEMILDQHLYNTEEFRTLGHIAERLLPIYVEYVRSKSSSARIGFTGRTLYDSTVPFASVELPDKSNCISLMLACSDYYMKYTCVLLESLRRNLNDKFFYDVVICHRGISDYNQKVAKAIFEKHKNVLLRFVDVSRNFEQYENLYIDRHFTLETYYRFLMLDVFKGYDRILYLDCDMVINDDISELFFTDISGYCLGAVRDYDFIGGAVESRDFYKANILQHINIDSITNYFQAGMILFNIEEIKKSFTTQDLFETALARSWFYVDQDVLNCLFNGRVKYLDDRWNVFSLLQNGSIRQHRIKYDLVAKYAASYQKSLESPAIIHYAGSPKVWNDLDVHLGQIFWKYARTSPYYEMILSSLLLGEGTRNDWIVFCCPPNLGSSTLFFTIEPVVEDWASSYCVIEFEYLTNHGHFCTNTVSINISRLPDANNHFSMSVREFLWEKVIPVFENIYYVTKDTNRIEIYVKHFEQYAGFSFKVKSLESRSIAKPVIKINNHHHIF